MTDRSPAFWVGLAVGWVVIGFGAIGLLGDADVTTPVRLVPWFIGAGIAHDLVLAPIAVGVGWVTWRLVPERARVPVRLALAASAVVVAFTWPYVRGYGKAETNPSALPFDYGRNLLMSLAAIWLACGLAVALILRRPNQRRP